MKACEQMAWEQGREMEQVSRRARMEVEEERARVALGMDEKRTSDRKHAKKEISPVRIHSPRTLPAKQITRGNANVRSEEEKQKEREQREREAAEWNANAAERVKASAGVRPDSRHDSGSGRDMNHSYVGGFRRHTRSRSRSVSSFGQYRNSKHTREEEARNPYSEAQSRSRSWSRSSRDLSHSRFGDTRDITVGTRFNERERYEKRSRHAYTPPSGKRSRVTDTYRSAESRSKGNSFSEASRTPHGREPISRSPEYR